VEKAKLLELLQSNKADYTELITQRMKSFTYRKERYGYNFSLTIALCEEEMDLRSYCEHKRQSDEFIVLEQNLCCMVLDGTDTNSGVKAANNMLSSFQSHHFAKMLYSSIVSSDEYAESTELINELFYVLKHAIENNMDNIVVDAHSVFKD